MKGGILCRGFSVAVADSRGGWLIPRMMSPKHNGCETGDLTEADDMERETRWS